MKNEEGKRPDDKDKDKDKGGNPDCTSEHGLSRLGL